MFLVAATDLANTSALDSVQLFFGGAVGGLVGFVLAIGIPYLHRMLEEAEEADQVLTKPTRRQYAGLVGLLLANIFMGGVAAVIVGDAIGWGPAIASGMAWPVVLKGAGEGLQTLGAVQGRADSGTDSDASGTAET